MPCCGQKRNALKTTTSSSVDHAAGHHRQPAAHASSLPTAPVPAMIPNAYPVALQYTESSAIVVEGAATHRRYEFSSLQPIQMVDCRDAEALLRTRFFLQR